MRSIRYSSRNTTRTLTSPPERELCSTPFKELWVSFEVELIQDLALRKLSEEASKGSNPWVLVYTATNVEGRPYWLPKDFDRGTPEEGGKSMALAHKGIRVEPVALAGGVTMLASSKEDQESRELEEEDGDGWLSTGELEEGKAMRELVGRSAQVPQVRGDKGGEGGAMVRGSKFEVGL